MVHKKKKKGKKGRLQKEPEDSYLTIKGDQLETTFANSADLQNSGSTHWANITSQNRKVKHLEYEHIHRYNIARKNCAMIMNENKPCWRGCAQDTSGNSTKSLRRNLWVFKENWLQKAARIKTEDQYQQGKDYLEHRAAFCPTGKIKLRKWNIEVFKLWKQHGNQLS